MAAAIATFAAVCYSQGDDANDTVPEGFPVSTAELDDLARQLISILPAVNQVTSALDLEEGDFSSLFSQGFLASSGDDLDEHFLGANWVRYGGSFYYEPDEDEPWEVVVAISVYDDAASAAEALDVGPQMFTPMSSFLDGMDTSSLEVISRPGDTEVVWIGERRPGLMGAAMISHDQFVLSVLGAYGLQLDFETALLTAARRLEAEIDFSQLATN